MKRQDVVAAISDSTDLSKKDVASVLTELEAVVSDSVRAGEKVELTGFVSFEAADRAARTGRNPATGEVLEIPARKAVKVTAGSRLKALFKG